MVVVQSSKKWDLSWLMVELGMFSLPALVFPLVTNPIPLVSGDP